MNDLYAFVFRGLLSEEALDKAGRQSPNNFSSEIEKAISERLSLELIDADQVKDAMQMSPVYVAIAAFENSVRDFVKKRLLEEIGEDWWEKAVSEKVRNISETRKNEESKIRWHSPRGDSLIEYVVFGDLISIIRNNWQLFEDYLHSIEWAQQIFKTLEISRNVIMHSGKLEVADIERIGTSIRDWIRQVGS